MLKWKQESAGTTALLVEGPRRVGKSTIVKSFAEQEYKSYILIDFAKASKEEKNLFDDISDLNYFFMRMKLLEGVSLYDRNSLIVFDEVQRYPTARQAIKYLVEDGRYDYIETGSLISIHQNVDDIVIPSEEEQLSMFPMDYEEFRWALGDNDTINLLLEQFKSGKPMGDDVNRKMMRDFRLYMLVGGMPQAVDKYINTYDLSVVDKTKRDILRLYEQDFHKLDNTDKAKALFKAIPAELHKNSTRFQVTTIIGKTQTDTLNSILDLMEDSKTINIAYNADDPNVSMELYANKSAYKMYICDTGLFVTLAFWDKQFTENIIYKKLLNDSLDTNLGYVYENVVAQMLTAAGDKLFYYTWRALKTTSTKLTSYFLAVPNYGQ